MFYCPQTWKTLKVSLSPENMVGKILKSEEDWFPLEIMLSILSARKEEGKNGGVLSGENPTTSEI